MSMMSSGKYMIVDPCYVLTDEQYQVMLNTIWSDGDSQETDTCIIDDKKFLVYGTAYGDGGYSNTFNNNKILVDSGLIAIIPVELLSEDAINSNTNNSAIVEYESCFYCENNDGIMNFGHVTVDTKEDDDEEDDDYWDDEDDEDDEDY